MIATSAENGLANGPCDESRALAGHMGGDLALTDLRQPPFPAASTAINNF